MSDTGLDLNLNSTMGMLLIGLILDATYVYFKPFPD
jgi:hypothetical protein